MEELLESGLREHVSPLSCGAPRGRNCVFLLSTPHAQASQVSQMVENLSAMQETWVQSLSQEDSPGEGNGYPLQYSCLDNSMDRGAWQFKGERLYAY